MVWDGQERRRFPRVVFPCKTAVGSPIRWLTSHTENISAGGIRVILDERLRVYNSVSLELFFEKEAATKCNGRIAWVKEEANPLDMQNRPTMFVTGIEFIEILDYDREYIKRLVKLLSFLKKK